MKKIITIGSAMLDTFIQYENPESIEIHRNGSSPRFIALQEGTKIDVEKLDYYSGGGAINTATSFARLGFDTTIFCKVGTDSAGDFIIKDLEKNNVKTTLINKNAQQQTGTSFIIPSPSGNRAVLVYRGANLTLHEEPFPQQALSEHDYIYVASLSGQTSELLPKIAKFAHKAGIPIASNPGTSQLTANVDTLAQALPYLSALILNAYEASLLMDTLAQNAIQSSAPHTSDSALPLLLRSSVSAVTGYFTVRTFFAEILKRGCPIVVVTNGADGVYVTDGKTIFYHPSARVQVVSTIAAGDSFASTFVAALAQEKTIIEAIRSGIVNCGSVLESINAKSGLLTQEALNHKLQFFNPELMQTFPL